MNPQRPFYAQGSSNSPAQSPSFSQNGSPIPAQHFGSPSFQQQVIEFQRSQQLLAQQGLLNSQGGNPGRQNVPPGQNGMNFPGLQGMQGLPGMQGMQGIQGMPGIGGQNVQQMQGVQGLGLSSVPMPNQAQRVVGNGQVPQGMQRTANELLNQQAQQAMQRQQAQQRQSPQPQQQPQPTQQNQGGRSMSPNLSSQGLSPNINIQQSLASQQTQARLQQLAQRQGISVPELIVKLKAAQAAQAMQTAQAQGSPSPQPQAGPSSQVGLGIQAGRANQSQGPAYVQTNHLQSTRQQQSPRPPQPMPVSSHQPQMGYASPQNLSPRLPQTRPTGSPSPQMMPLGTVQQQLQQGQPGPSRVSASQQAQNTRTPVISPTASTFPSKSMANFQLNLPPTAMKNASASTPPRTVMSSGATTPSRPTPPPGRTSPEIALKSSPPAGSPSHLTSRPAVQPAPPGMRPISEIKPPTIDSSAIKPPRIQPPASSSSPSRPGDSSPRRSSVTGIVSNTTRPSTEAKPQGTSQGTFLFGTTTERPRIREEVRERPIRRAQVHFHEPEKRTTSEALRGCMRDEIAKLMYAAGDVSAPISATVDVLEDMAIDFVAELCRPVSPIRANQDSNHQPVPLTTPVIRHRLASHPSLRKYLQRFDIMSHLSSDLAKHRRSLTSSESHHDLVATVGKDYLGIKDDDETRKGVTKKRGRPARGGASGPSRGGGGGRDEDDGPKEKRKPGPKKGWKKGVKRVKREHSGSGRASAVSSESPVKSSPA